MGGIELPGENNTWPLLDLGKRSKSGGALVLSPERELHIGAEDTWGKRIPDSETSQMVKQNIKSNRL